MRARCVMSRLTPFGRCAINKGVTQSEPTVAVNYWYDRAFDALWALETCVEELVGALDI